MKNLVEPIRNKSDIEAIEYVLKRNSARNHLIFVFGLNTGLRVSDILGLNIDDVKNKNYIEIHEKKTGKYKKFPLNNKLKKLIKNYLIKRAENYTILKEEPLFVGKKHYRLDRSQVYRFLNKACIEIGLKINVGTHTMRKSFGYHFYQKYKDVALLQKILNHSNPSITLRYIGIDQDEIDCSYKNFEL